MILGEIVAS